MQVLSLAAGDHAEHLATLHRQNREAYELEVRLQALAERARSQGGGGSAPGSPHREGGDAQGRVGESVAEPGTDAVAAASKSLLRSSRTMRASMIAGAEVGTPGLLPGSGRGRGRGRSSEEGGLGQEADLIPQSMRTGWMQNIPLTESVVQLRQMIK